MSEKADIRAAGSVSTNITIETGEDEGSLCDLLDRLLDTGVVIRGDLVLTVADIDLVYVGVHALAASMETIRETLGGESPIEWRGRGPSKPDAEARP